MNKFSMDDEKDDGMGRPKKGDGLNPGSGEKESSLAFTAVGGLVGVGNKSSLIS